MVVLAFHCLFAVLVNFIIAAFQELFIADRQWNLKFCCTKSVVILD